MEAIIIKDRSVYFRYFFKICHQYPSYAACYRAIENEIENKYKTRVFESYAAFRVGKTRFLRNEAENAQKS